mmetsp:Transcript_44497/g.85120  ORF Transcript_44497/g.85120 Transcript_44497/m.85120 type:complete len:88 (-) Transcript_44497:107-370(-)
MESGGEQDSDWQCWNGRLVETKRLERRPGYVMRHPEGVACWVALRARLGIYMCGLKSDGGLLQGGWDGLRSLLTDMDVRWSNRGKQI